MGVGLLEVASTPGGQSPAGTWATSAPTSWGARVRGSAAFWTRHDSPRFSAGYRTCPKSHAHIPLLRRKTELGGEAAPIVRDPSGWVLRVAIPSLSMAL